MIFSTASGIDFNPRSPWGERLAKPLPLTSAKRISIHALREESDAYRLSGTAPTNGISIHALREESDPTISRPVPPYLHFNPRSPWGERRVPSVLRASRLIYFNPRSPWGERRCGVPTPTTLNLISIHALREESDLSTSMVGAVIPKISIHALREESDIFFVLAVNPQKIISIHALREESDKCRYN